MINKTKAYGFNTVKLLIFSLITVFIFHPLSATPDSVCSINKEKNDPVECRCCSGNNNCGVKSDCDSGNNNETSCVCKFNAAEPAEEQKNPVNISSNIQKLIAGIKSGLFITKTDSDIKESFNLEIAKTDISSIKYDIYIEISNLRI
jgi:hypothetical protein